MINGGFKRKTLGIWSFIKKINGRSNKVTYWGSKLFIEETWPRTKHIWLHCSSSDFVQLSNNPSIHFCMSSKISEELQQDKFSRFWRRNLNGIFSVSRDWSSSFIFNLFDLVNKSDRKSRLFEEQQPGQKSLPLFVNNCWEIWQKFASKQADCKEFTPSSSPNLFCRQPSSTYSS